MNIEDCVIKSKEWLHELNHKQLVQALCGEVNHDLDKTVELFESMLDHLEDSAEQNYYFNERIKSSNDQAYDDGYAEAIRDVVFKLNNQGVDSDIISLIEDM